MTAKELTVKTTTAAQKTMRAIHTTHCLMKFTDTAAISLFRHACAFGRDVSKAWQERDPDRDQD